MYMVKSYLNALGHQNVLQRLLKTLVNLESICRRQGSIAQTDYFGGCKLPKI